MSLSEPRTVMPDAIPGLEPGDTLNRQEFERRYAAMPNLKKAELLDGVVYMPSPVRMPQHAEPHCHLLMWLGHYRAFTDVCTAVTTPRFGWMNTTSLNRTLASSSIRRVRPGSGRKGISRGRRS